MRFENISSNSTPDLIFNHSAVKSDDDSSSPHFVVRIMILVVALLGNVLVLIIVFGKSSKRRKVPHDIMVAHLSIADLALVVTTVLCDVLKIPKSRVFCAVIYPLNSATLLMSMFILAAMADLRRRIILNPFEPTPSSRSVNITVACLWIVAGLAMAPFAAVLRFSDGFCPEEWPSLLLNKMYTVGLSVITYVIPIAVICVSYCRIVIFLRRHVKNAKYLQLTPRREEREFMKASLILVLLYTMLTLPINLAWNLTVVFQVEVAPSLFRYFNVLVYIQSCCNPFVYGVITARFRRGFAHYLSYLCRRWNRADFTVDNHSLHYVPSGDTNEATADVRLITFRSDTQRELLLTQYPGASNSQLLCVDSGFIHS